MNPGQQLILSATNRTIASAALVSAASYQQLTPRQQESAGGEEEITPQKCGNVDDRRGRETSHCCARLLSPPTAGILHSLRKEKYKKMMN